MKKKAFTLVEMIAVVVIIAIIAVLAVPPILQSVRRAKNDISDAMKKVIVSASDIYMGEDKDNYVRYNGNRYCITLKQLVESEKLNNPIYDPTTSQEISQDKFVQVDIFDNEYSYEIVDNCEEIRRHSLAYILKQQYKEGNTSGLLKDTDGSYYYKGTNEEVSNNFVWFGGHLWRVLTINEDNTLTMITQQPLTAIVSTGSAWDTSEKYKASYINTWLNDVFLNSMSETDKLEIQNNIFNIGIQTNVSEITTTQKIGLLDAEQYLKTGGQNFFLDIKDVWWLGNRYGAANNIMRISENGILGSNDGVHESGVRPVIKISDLTNTTGEGTLDNPFRESSKTTNTANIKVGEYISVPTSGTDCGEDKRCLFRVVSKDNDSIKVILNGLLPRGSQFASTSGAVTYSSGNTIDIALTTFASTIDSQYRYTGNKKFNIGESTIIYNSVQRKTYIGNIGLPVVGEMFSGNDIDVTYPAGASKIFVNVATIENSTVSDSFWTMNTISPEANLMASYIVSDGTLSRYGQDGTAPLGVRPVLFLKNNLKFTGGEGTAEHPFTLE